MSNRRVDRLIRRWWAGELGPGGILLTGLLAPAEALYRAGVAGRNRAYDHRLLRVVRSDIPVISIGNVSVGGTGKTPFAHWLANRLAARGESPAVLHGGYGADEPELHRRWAPHIPVVVARDRVAAAQRAQQAGATVAVLDDAFQHRRLHRDLDIVLVSAERWSHAARLLPRGPWREPHAALRRADLVICTRKTATADQAAGVTADIERISSAPVAGVHLRADTWLNGGSATTPPARPSLLIAALATPEMFIEDARAAGADVADTMIFPDHHAYSAGDVADIVSRAAGRPMITTEKDWTKLDALLDSSAVWLLRQTVVPEHGLALIDSALDRVLQ